jgi:hypothetical protein
MPISVIGHYWQIAMLSVCGHQLTTQLHTIALRIGKFSQFTAPVAHPAKTCPCSYSSLQSRSRRALPTGQLCFCSPQLANQACSLLDLGSLATSNAAHLRAARRPHMARSYTQGCSPSSEPPHACCSAHSRVLPRRHRPLAVRAATHALSGSFSRLTLVFSLSKNPRDRKKSGTENLKFDLGAGA